MSFSVWSSLTTVTFVIWLSPSLSVEVEEGAGRSGDTGAYRLAERAYGLWSRSQMAQCADPVSQLHAARESASSSLPSLFARLLSD